MKASIKSLIIAVPLVLTASLGMAQDDVATPESIIADLDTDGNGTLSMDEAGANEMLGSNFSVIDENGDMELSATEIDAVFGNTAEYDDNVTSESVIADMDLDGNGTLSQEEADANELVGTNFTKIDVNGDNEISVEELDMVFGD